MTQTDEMRAAITNNASLNNNTENNILEPDVKQLLMWLDGDTSTATGGQEGKREAMATINNKVRLCQRLQLKKDRVYATVDHQQPLRPLRRPLKPAKPPWPLGWSVGSLNQVIATV